MPHGPYYEMLATNELLRKKFILHGKDETSIELLQPTRALGFPKDQLLPAFNGLGQVTTPLLLEKKLLYKNDKTGAKVSVINQSGEYHTLVYTSTPENIRRALRLGLFEPKGIQDPLAKMIAEIGVYRRTVFERSVELHRKITKNEERLNVAFITQHFLELLQPLNQCINSYQESMSSQENLDNILDKLTELEKKLLSLGEKLKGNKEPYLTLRATCKELARDTKVYARLVQQIENPTAEKVKEVLASYGTGNDQLKYFIQQQLNVITQAAIDANYAVTGLYQDASGLSDVLLNAQFTAEKYSSELVDYHNPTSQEHSLDFTHKQKNGLVNIDFGEYGFQPRNKADLAKRLALIDKIEEKKPLNDPLDEEVSLINFRGEKGTFPGYTAVKKIGFTLFNFGLDIFTSALDLLYAGFALSAGLVNFALVAFNREPFKIPLFPSERSFFQKWDSTESAYEQLPLAEKLYSDEPITKIRDSGIVVKISRLVGRLFTHFTFKPVLEVVKGLTSHLWQGLKNLSYDVTVGINTISDDEILSLLENRLKEEAKDHHDSQKAIASLVGDKYKKILEELLELEAAGAGEASADYKLNVDKPEDFVSWAGNDFVKGMMEVFSQEIYRVHPLASLAFTVAASAASPMLLPYVSKYAFLNFIYTKLNIPIAKALVGGPHGFMSAFSTALIEGKAAFLLADVANGKDSIFVKGTELFLENPVLAGLMGTAAIGLGYAIAFQAHIPWLSEEIAAEAGHAAFPYFELGVEGGKLAAILLESAVRYDTEEENLAVEVNLARKMEALRPQVRKSMRSGYMKEKGLESLSQEQEAQVELQVTEYLDTFKKALSADFTNPMLLNIEKDLANYVARYTEQSVSALESTIDVAKTQENFKRARIREQLLQVDVESLPDKERYKLLHYVNTHYADDPEYVAAVKYKLNGGKEKLGGFAGSIKMALAYIPAIFRSIFSLTVSAGLAVGSLFNPDLLVKAKMAMQPTWDLLEKGRADLGLIVRVANSLLKVTWELVGSILRVPLVLTYSIFASPFLAVQYLVTDEHYVPTPLEASSMLSNLFFAPGKLSQLFNALVGFLRGAASAKNLELATAMTEARETSETMEVLKPLVSAKIQGKEKQEQLIEELFKPVNNTQLMLESMAAINLESDFPTQQSELIPVGHFDHPLAPVKVEDKAKQEEVKVLENK